MYFVSDNHALTFLSNKKFQKNTRLENKKKKQLSNESPLESWHYPKKPPTHRWLCSMASTSQPSHSRFTWKDWCITQMSGQGKSQMSIPRESDVHFLRWFTWNDPEWSFRPKASIGYFWLRFWLELNWRMILESPIHFGEEQVDANWKMSIEWKLLSVVFWDGILQSRQIFLKDSNRPLPRD